MHDVSAGWLMTSMAPEPVLVSLVQAAGSLPMFLFALPAGALADIVERRKVLLATQLWMLVCAAALAVAAGLDRIGPWGLLGFTAALGMGAALDAPAWQAIVPELVPRAQLSSAVVLNGVAVNGARAIGPALGGLVVAAFLAASRLGHLRQDERVTIADRVAFERAREFQKGDALPIVRHLVADGER